MFGKLFAKTVEPVKAQKSTNEIIQEIHETFNTEVDRLLEEAGVLGTLETDKQALIEKCDRLKKLGFKNSAEVVEAEREINRLNEIKRENERKQGLIDAINHFSLKYPCYKFITEESVKRICKTYGLVYEDVANYNGIVPDLNLRHIEEFGIDKKDRCYRKKTLYNGFGLRNFTEAQNIGYDKTFFETERDYVEFRDLGYRVYCYESPLEIAAPASDFNLENMQINDFKVSEAPVPDPIVLQPVFFGNQKHYLIVTAWGIEAEDSEVMNPNHN